MVATLLMGLHLMTRDIKVVATPFDLLYILLVYVMVDF